MRVAYQGLMVSRGVFRSKKVRGALVFWSPANAHLDAREAAWAGADRRCLFAGGGRLQP